MKISSRIKIIFEIVFCMIMVAIILYQKLCVGVKNSGDNTEHVKVLVEKNDKTIPSGQKEDEKEKKKKVKDDILKFGEEEEDAGIIYTIVLSKYKKIIGYDGKDIYRYRVRCHVKNCRNRENVNLNKFEKCISVKIGDVEKNPNDNQNARYLAPQEETDLEVKIDFSGDEVKNPNDFKVYYTTEEEEDEYINVFRTQYVIE